MTGLEKTINPDKIILDNITADIDRAMFVRIEVKGDSKAMLAFAEEKDPSPRMIIYLIDPGNA